MPLTPKQEQFYNLLKLYFDRFGKAPSNEELRQWLEENNWGEGAPIKSIRSVTQYLDALEKLGKIRREPHRSRGITLMERPDLVQIPLLTSPVACGTPLTLIEETASEFVPVSRRLAPQPEKYYLFRTYGDSMTEAGIDPGDTVLVEQTYNFSDNDIVLAVINGSGTFKRLKRSDHTITLLPDSSNPDHSPIYLHEADDFMIAGKVKHIFKH